MNRVRGEFVLELVFVNSESHLREVVRNLLGTGDHDVSVLPEHVTDELVVSIYILYQRFRRLNHLLLLNWLIYGRHFQ
jgi:hypothetical protein